MNGTPPGNNVLDVQGSAAVVGRITHPESMKTEIDYSHVQVTDGLGNKSVVDFSQPHRLVSSDDSTRMTAPYDAGPLPTSARLYYELLYAVSRKYPGETRHETALRYIREAEAQYGQAGEASAEKS